MLRSVLRHHHQPFTCCIAKLTARSHQSLTKPLDSDSQALELVRECCRRGSLEQAKHLHSRILQSGIKNLRIFSKYVIRMYASCGSLERARKAFEDVHRPDLISWTEVISAFARSGSCDEAFIFFRQMLLDGVRPDIITVLAVVYSCKNREHLERGKFLHRLIVEIGYELDSVVGDRLLLMYQRCGGVQERMELFSRLKKRKTASPAAVMKMLIQSGKSEIALEFFTELESPRKLDFMTALEACHSAPGVEEVHGKMISSGMGKCSSLASALAQAYIRCGSPDAAKGVLKKRWSADPLHWTRVISALTRHGFEKRALELFHQMQRVRVKPVAETFAAILEACSGLGALIEGKLIHKRLLEESLEIDAALATKLVNMYSRCVSLREACSAFAEATSRSVGLWNALIDAFAAHDQGHLVLELFRKMQQEGFRPDQETFSSMLRVCSSHGLFQAGYSLFAMLKIEHELSPSLSNFVSMVELLGRAGELDESEKLISSSQFSSSATLWTSFLWICRSRGDLERGKKVSVHLFSLEPTNTTALVILSRIYSWESRPEMSERIHKLKNFKENSPAAARSWIEIKGIVHEFTTGDRSHPEAAEINEAIVKLEKVMGEIRASDHQSLVMHDVEEETRDCLWSHSERLAMVFGLMNAEESSRLVIFKNRRVCGDCHGVLAAVSKLSGKEIVVRDSSRFHYFSAGACSCGNYW